MIFKLVVPHIDRLMKRGIVSKWHKSVGDHVGYGEDVLDLTVELVTTSTRASLREQIEFIDTAKSVRQDGLSTVETPISTVARVTSSDVGILRRVEAEEGTTVQVGDLLAIVSADDCESTDLLDQNLAEASEFRVVTNLGE